MKTLPTARESFKKTLDELGFSGYKSDEMTNSDYWLCACTAMESHTASHTNELVERVKELEEIIVGINSCQMVGITWPNELKQKVEKIWEASE